MTRRTKPFFRDDQPRGRARCPRNERPTRVASGKKLYAVRAKSGKFKDIQTYKKAHGADVKKRSRAETKSKKK